MEYQGKTIVITGATSGLGQAAAIDLGKRGARILCLGRDAARGAAVVSEIKRAGGQAEFLSVDLLSIADLSRVAAELLSRVGSIDVLINNAGGNFKALGKTGDGFEKTFALNVVAPFVLSHRLRPALRAAGGRIINVATGVPGGASLELADLREPRSYSALGTYTKAKLAVIMMTLEQAERWKADSISAVVIHPGIIPGTRFGSEMPAAMLAIGSFIAKLFGMASTPAQAQERYRQAAFGAVPTGTFLAQGKPAQPPKAAQDPAQRRALWDSLESTVKA
jgi:NAD(P)-dependent dehydrogenase (short-subunit alcohol dehydrogenase family)